MKPAELIEQGRFLGEEFLLWIWMRGLTSGGTSGRHDDTSACFVDDAISLASESGDVKHIGLTKGNPAECREAFEALSRGMRPASAKVRLLAGDMEWVCTLQSADLIPRGLKLPPTQAKDQQGRLADRAFLVDEFTGHLERRYVEFLRQDRVELESHLHDWIMTGLGPSDGQ